MNFDKSYNDYQTNEMLIDFAEKISQKSNLYDKIVLTTRRCFCLINCIQKLEEIFSDEVWNKIITSQSINIHRKELEEKNILLVDDIMIHGRSVFSIYEKLQDCNVKSIDTFVLARNLEYPDFYKTATGQKYESMFLLSNCDWKMLSNEIIDYFYSNLIPYISYIYSLDDITFANDFVAIRKSSQYQEILNRFNPNNKVISEYVFLPCSNSLTKYNCVRKYEYANKCIYVPYFELKNFISDSLTISWKNLLMRIDVINEKLHTFTPIEIYKVYTIIFSLLLFDLEQINSPEIEKSYYCGFNQDIKLIIYKLKDITNCSIEALEDLLLDCGLQTCNDYFNNNGSIYFDELLSSQLNQSEDCSDRIKKFFEYISVVSNKEEYQFKKMLPELYLDKDLLLENYKKSLKHIPSSIVLNTFKNDRDDGVTDYDLVAFVIALLDLGSISHSVEEFVSSNGKRFISTVIKTGEQSYKIPYVLYHKSFCIAAKFCDFHKLFYGNLKFTEQEIWEYIYHLKTNSLKCFEKDSALNKLLNEIQIVLTQLSDDSLCHILDIYKVLCRKEDMDSVRFIVEDTLNYFVNTD